MTSGTIDQSKSAVTEGACKRKGARRWRRGRRKRRSRATDRPGIPDLLSVNVTCSTHHSLCHRLAGGKHLIGRFKASHGGGDQLTNLGANIWKLGNAHKLDSYIGNRVKRGSSRVRRQDTVESQLRERRCPKILRPLISRLPGSGRRQGPPVCRPYQLHVLFGGGPLYKLQRLRAVPGCGGDGERPGPQQMGTE